MTKRVLLTGARGFIGRHAIAPLRARNFEIHTIGRRPTEGIPHHQADLLDPKSTAAIISALEPTHLLHLAWDVTPGAFWHSRTNLDWVAASLSLYRSFVAAGGRHVAVAGTCAEYDWTHPHLDEDSPLHPATIYGLAKHTLHRLLTAAAAADATTIAWGRIFLLYGPHEAPERLVSGIARALLRGEDALTGRGDLKRDFMHVADVAAALVLLLDQSHHGPVNIATGQSTTIAEVVTTIAAQTDHPDRLRIGARPSPPSEPLELATSALRLRALGFQPRYTLESGLADTVAWWKSTAAPPR